MAISSFFGPNIIIYIRQGDNLLEKAAHALHFRLIFNKYNDQSMRTTQMMPEFGHIQDGTTWIGGPTHELQKQHIPGYMGHVHSLYAENVHGKNFARVTSECLNQRTNYGINVPKVFATINCRKTSIIRHTARNLASQTPEKHNL